jgi:hypothetical protein
MLDLMLLLRNVLLGSYDHDTGRYNVTDHAAAIHRSTVHRNANAGNRNGSSHRAARQLTNSMSKPKQQFDAQPATALAIADAPLIVTTATAGYQHWLGHLHRNLKLLHLDGLLRVCAADAAAESVVSSLGLRLATHRDNSSTGGSAHYGLPTTSGKANTFMSVAWRSAVHFKQVAAPRPQPDARRRARDDAFARAVCGVGSIACGVWSNARRRGRCCCWSTAT